MTRLEDRQTLVRDIAQACAVAGHRDFVSTSRSQALFHDPKCKM
jgi:hypothetical protein